MCDTHSKRSSARETRSQLHLHPVKSISTTYYGKKLEVGQAQRDPLLALDTRSWGPWRETQDRVELNQSTDQLPGPDRVTVLAGVTTNHRYLNQAWDRRVFN